LKSLQEIYFSNLNVVCNTGGIFFCPADFSWAYHTHTFDQNKFYFITSGQCTITVEGTTYHARAGQWFFIPAGANHSYSNISGCTFQKFWMHFDLYPSADLFNMLDLPYFVNVPENSVVYDLFRQADEAMKSDHLTQRIHLKTCLFSLLCEYINLVHPDGVSVEDTDDRIDQILRYINSHLDKSLSIAELAEIFHVHPAHFIRFFREKTGETPAKYIRIRRLENAKRMLEATDMNVSAIMEQLGFLDESQFSKQFKKYYGHSPRNYRKYFRNSL
jgi:AraC-like DNA-binding protein